MSDDVVKIADPNDTCECGDYRKDHVDGVGPCRFNGGGFDLLHCGQDCHRFRLDEAYLEKDLSHDRVP